MSLLTIIVGTFLFFSTSTIIDFNQKSDLKNWYVVDDVVMGGRSDSQFYINAEGNAVFEGNVSLENNGGFSSVRYLFDQKSIDAYHNVAIRLKGDGKRYQFRVKTSRYDRHSYVSYFQTTGDWQIVQVPLKEMYATFRGMRLNMPNFPGRNLEEITILIGNKKAESFRLELDNIVLTD
jgi:hypothetical protein